MTECKLFYIKLRKYIYTPSESSELPGESGICESNSSISNIPILENKGFFKLMKNQNISHVT